MVEHLHVALVAAIVGGLATLLVVFMWRWCCSTKHYKDLVGSSVMTATTPTTNGLQIGIERFHQQSTIHRQFDLDNKMNRGNYFVFRRGPSSKVKFNWAEHPSLVTEAVENGWSQFAFTSNSSTYMSSPSSKASTLLGLCTTGDPGRQTDVQISWEVYQGSVDYMQKVRLNPGMKRIYANNSPLSVASVIRTALPMPGPNLGNSSFPQEAYFEITVLYCREEEGFESSRKSREGEKTKLIQADSKANSNSNSDASFHVNNSPVTNNNSEDLKADVKLGKGEILMFSLGLSAGGSLPLKIPGSYPGSIGFNSSGSVYLDGVKIVYESDAAEWGKADKVIGCGFDPREKKVFFTVDSQLVHTIHCSPEEFVTPLYPTLAANAEVLVLVNLGQSEFKYAPANAQRTPNPGFTGPLMMNSAALGYEDSRELFSMGRIDSQWFNRTTTKGSHNNNGYNNNGPESFEEESEADLFEISLDNGGKSQSAV